MEDHLPGVGPLTRRGFTAEEQSDIDHAVAVARDMGVHDVGQTVMVKRGMVLAVEAFEGTNRAIRRGGRLGGKGSVIFKAAREGHDMRFDIPVIGLNTVKMMKRAGATALGFQAGRQIVLDRDEVVRFADRPIISALCQKSYLSWKTISLTMALLILFTKTPPIFSVKEKWGFSIICCSKMTINNIMSLVLLFLLIV